MAGEKVMRGFAYTYVIGGKRYRIWSPKPLKSKTPADMRVELGGRLADDVLNPKKGSVLVIDQISGKPPKARRITGKEKLDFTVDFLVNFLNYLQSTSAPKKVAKRGEKPAFGEPERVEREVPLEEERHTYGITIKDYAYVVESRVLPSELKGIGTRKIIAKLGKDTSATVIAKGKTGIDAKGGRRISMQSFQHSADIFTRIHGFRMTIREISKTETGRPRLKRL